MGHSHVPDGKAFLAAFLGLEVCSENGWSAGEVGPVPVLLSQLFSKQFPQMSAFSPWSSWTGASDASAEKEGESWIGGWLTDSPEPKDKVLWFQYRVCQEHHPWAFKKKNCGFGALWHFVLGTAADGAESFNLL